MVPPLGCAVPYSNQPCKWRWACLTPTPPPQMAFLPHYEDEPPVRHVRYQTAGTIHTADCRGDPPICLLEIRRPIHIELLADTEDTAPDVAAHFVFCPRSNWKPQGFNLLRTNPPYPQSDWSPIAPENSPTPFQDVSLWSTSDLYRGGPAAGARSPKPIDSLNLGFAGQPNQCLDDRTPIHQPLLSSGVLKPKTVQHRVAESAIEDAEVANRAPRKAWYRPNPYLYYRRFWKPQEVLAIAPWDEFATAKPFSAAAALPPRTALQPHPKMTTSSMEPSTDLEKGELRPLLAPTTEHDANEFADEPIDAANEATTASLLTTIATSTSLLCSALLISLYRHPLTPCSPPAS
ncbi:hypothetical protein BFW01_g10799 [Lasiodiplodia theobromae]|uniref:Uncharacterized protein n=1 Tax=Lasiodiplodia theobromae TaxID=45133 RepID=A0A8H7IPZ0_9PEZI|nr:hypothetical protein BFW01_g10799 [Lasiodiplodia theobromae]